MYVKIKRVIDYERYKHDIHRLIHQKREAEARLTEYQKKLEQLQREEK